MLRHFINCVSLFQYGLVLKHLNKSFLQIYCSVDCLERVCRSFTYNKHSSRQPHLHSPSCHRKAGPDWCTLGCCWGLRGDTETCFRGRLSLCSWPRRCHPHSPGSRHSGTTAEYRGRSHIETVHHGMLGSLSTKELLYSDQRIHTQFFC